MTTKNIKDVVAEKLNNLYENKPFLVPTKKFEKTELKYGDWLWIENWLTTTLTQLVKEVEEGERDRCDIRIRKEAEEHVSRKIAHGKAMYEKGKKERD